MMRKNVKKLLLPKTPREEFYNMWNNGEYLSSMACQHRKNGSSVLASCLDVFAWWHIFCKI